MGIFGSKHVDEMAQRVGSTADKFGDFLDTASDYTKPAAIGAAGLGGGYFLSKLRDYKKQDAQERYYRKRLEELEKRAGLVDDLKGVAGKFSPGNIADKMGMEPETKDLIGNQFKRTAVNTAMGIGAGAAIGGASRLYNKAKNKFDDTAQKRWEKFVDKYPEYADEPDAKEHFSMMHETTPSMTKYPTAVKSYMRSSFDMSNNANFEALRRMGDIESGMDRRSNGSIEDAMHQATGLVDDLSRSLEQGLHESEMQKVKMRNLNIRNQKDIADLKSKSVKNPRTGHESPYFSDMDANYMMQGGNSPLALNDMSPGQIADAFRQDLRGAASSEHPGIYHAARQEMSKNEFTQSVKDALTDKYTSLYQKRGMDKDQARKKAEQEAERKAAEYERKTRG